MSEHFNRRQFLGQAAASGLALAGGAGLAKWAVAEDKGPAAGGAIPPLTVISGKPRDRGRMYGSRFKDAIHSFLDREIYQAFTQKPSPKDDMLRYAGACGKEIRRYTPIIYDELEGMAEGAGLGLDEVLLITLHEELYHRGVLPKIDHCTAIAVGPPDTADGNTYVGQTWDWMQSVFGTSSMLHWKRDEGPSLLSYAFPGLWVGAGLNSAGLALCWTSADLGNKALGARVGIPAYVLLAHLMYQESLDAVEEEARRAKNAGWFTFVMGDGRGHLCNIEGSPHALVVERSAGRLARIGFGTRPMTGTAEGAAVPLHPRCVKMNELLAGAAGKIELATIQHFFQDPGCAIYAGRSTIDIMVYNATGREAWLSRGPEYGIAWKRFTFDV
jgi:isopenicillin-N N-acyltransferase-like protein